MTLPSDMSKYYQIIKFNGKFKAPNRRTIEEPNEVNLLSVSINEIFQ